MVFLSASGISKKEADSLVVNDVSYTQQQFQQLAIAGETGSGKSTLLKIVAGLAQPDSGEVIFKGERIRGPLEKLIPGHPAIAYLSQHFELRNNYRVEEILSYANMLADRQAATIFEICQISHLLKRRTDQISGGEKQRIAIARLLVSSPQLLILDEPYSNLDMHHKMVLQSVIHDIANELKITCTLVSHDPEDVLPWADEIIVMKAGSIVQQGTPEEIYEKPNSEYTAALFGKYNLLQPRQSRAFRTGNPGKALFARPEHFKIVKKGAEAVEGTVVKINFMGGFYELEVSASGAVITVRTMNCDLNKGDTIYLSLDLDRVWYI